MKPSAYSHRVDSVECVETLLSWVFLSGEYAYKVKKPLHLDFVDFSTLELRHHFCLEEVRCNQAFAPELYLGVVPILRKGTGELFVASAGSEQGADVVDWAVKMCQFEPDAQADRRLDAGLLTCEELESFGRTLAVQHRTLVPAEALLDATVPIMDNFRTLHTAESAVPIRPMIETLELATRADLEELGALLARRQTEGFVRECHGDLHLANLVLTDSGLRAFDCLEFDRGLRIIDVWSDAAFLFMDCCVRAREDLAYAFIDGYLDVSGDYEGALLLPMFARYRSLVRAKVAALRLDQHPDAAAPDKLAKHLEWAFRNHHRPPGHLFATCGVSGSGKSYWASRLVSPLSAIRLRSDVLRKRLLGLEPGEKTGSGLATDAYGQRISARVYRRLAALAGDLLRRGENVIVDCANLKADQRRLFHDAAVAAGATCTVLHFKAPSDELERRISQREFKGDDPSEADLDVLRWQLRNQEAPVADGSCIVIETAHATLQDILQSLL